MKVYFYDYSACFKHDTDGCEECPFDSSGRELLYSTVDNGFNIDTGLWGSGMKAYRLTPISKRKES